MVLSPWVRLVDTQLKRGGCLTLTVLEVTNMKDCTKNTLELVMMNKVN